MSKDSLNNNREINSLSMSKESFEVDMKDYLRVTRQKILYGTVTQDEISNTYKYENQIRSLSPQQNLKSGKFFKMILTY